MSERRIRQNQIRAPRPSICSLFEQAGWVRGRTVKVSARVSSGHPARAILSSFAGLRVGVAGPGLECAASDIAFRDRDSEHEFESQWSPYLRSQLICVGGQHNEHGELFIDSLGRVFGASLIHDAFWLDGENVWAGIENVLLGRRSRPLLHPDQDAVMLYGQRFARGDPGIFLP